jgi:hypothetical protein
MATAGKGKYMAGQLDMTGQWNVNEAKLVLDNYMSNAGKEAQKLRTTL